MSDGPRVAIATDCPGWHGKRLARALNASGMETSFVSLPDCRIDLEAGRDGLHLPGFPGRMPDAVVVREIAAGTFEQITLRLGILHALTEWGVPVINSARAIERTVDKSMTSLLLSRAGLPTPATYVTESREHACAFVAREAGAGHRTVLKPLFGAQGKGLLLLDAPDQVPDPDRVQSVYYLQRFVASGEAPACDYRVFVVDDVAVATMRRLGSDWIHNVAQGGRCEGVATDPELEALARTAVRVVGAVYGGVDIIRGCDGVASVLEVNGIPAWRGLQSVTNVDIAASIAAAVHARLPGRILEPTAATAR